jgi:hypothetical protein
MKAAVSWDIAPCSPYMNQRFGGTYYLHLQGGESDERETSVLAALGDTFLRNVGRCVPEDSNFSKDRALFLEV